MVAGLITPLLENKEWENRKLKRLLSERYALDGDDEILNEEII